MKLGASAGSRTAASARPAGILVAAIAMSLAACGGGGGESSPAPAAPPPAASTSAEGVWTGKTSTNRDVAIVVLETGEYFAIYGTQSGVNGVLQGNSTINGSSVSSANGLDFPFGAGRSIPFTMSGSVTATKTLDGSLTESGQALTFTTAYDPIYDTPATSAAIAGKYAVSGGTLLGISSYTATIDGSGNVVVTPTGKGCALQGTAVPRKTGKGVYDVNLATVPSADCTVAVSTRGVGVPSGPSALALGGVAEDRSNAFYAIALKQ